MPPQLVRSTGRQVLPPARRPRPAAPARRDPRQPARPHRRSRTRRLARRSRGTQGQPRRRRHKLAQIDRRPAAASRPPRHARPGRYRRPHPHRPGPARPTGAVMTPPAVTSTLLHDLVTHSHAEGISALGVEAAIEHDDRILLIAEPGPDFTDETWQLPGRPGAARPDPHRRPAPRRRVHRADHRRDNRIPRPPRPPRRPGDHPGVPIHRHRHRSRRHLPPRRDRPPLGGGPGLPAPALPRR